MSMAADSNMNFLHGINSSSFGNQREVSFQSGAINSTVGVVQGGINCSEGSRSTSGMWPDGKASFLNNTSSMMVYGNSSNNLLLEPTAGLKHDTGLAADWSNNEQATMNHGLIRYADQPTVMKYVKIATHLPEKTVRDVALRCQWMSKKESSKRPKLEEYLPGKKFKYMKESMMDSSNKVIHPLGNVAGYPFMMHRVNHNGQSFSEAPIIDDATRQIMEENAQIQGNVNLFLHTRNNVRAILNSMSGMRGIMSQMPPLPVTLNEDLFTAILPKTSQERERCR